MNKSVSQQLLDYLHQNKGVFASGTIQRMEWRNANGTLATPRSLVRRLQELAERGEIQVQEINGHAHYSAEFIPPPKKQQITFKENEFGERIAVLSYV